MPHPDRAPNRKYGSARRAAAAPINVQPGAGVKRPSEDPSRRRRHRSSAAAPVHAPGAGTGEDQVEVDEAEQDGRHAHIDGRPWVHGEMETPIGDRHDPRQDEGDRARQETDQDENPADQFEDPRRSASRSAVRAESVPAGRQVEEDHHAAMDEKERGDDAEHGQRLRLIARETVGHGDSPAAA